MECDRCCAAHVVRYWHAETKAELRLCQHHADEFEPALLAKGWVGCVAVSALGPVTADTATH